jgi:SAM-dependent methyltransferase
MPPKLETVKTELDRICPSCGGRASHLVSSPDRNRHTTSTSFDYYTCMQCGLIFMQPPLKDMSPYYKGGYESIPATQDELRLIAAGEKYRTEPILRHKQSGRFLEIGPWRGVFCCNMKDAGFEVTGIEMDTSCVEFLRNELGIEALQSVNPVETMKTLKPGFDVIAAWHSLEHLPEPWLVIESAARLLAPGGILLLAMPNPESYEFSVMKDAWVHLDAPRHLYFFPIDSLIRTCGNYGLELLEVTTKDTCSRMLSNMAWQVWTRSWVPVRYIRGIIGISIGKLLYWYTCLKPEGLGSGYTVVFAKRY